MWVLVCSRSALLSPFHPIAKTTLFTTQAVISLCCHQPTGIVVSLSAVLLAHWHCPEPAGVVLSLLASSLACSCCCFMSFRLLLCCSGLCCVIWAFVVSCVLVGGWCGPPLVLVAHPCVCRVMSSGGLSCHLSLHLSLHLLCCVIWVFIVSCHSW